MQIFELHFNPKLREEQVFDSFIYEPENIYEKKLGNLYMVGELQNTLPQNARFLDNLARSIKAKYYTLSIKSPGKALSESLKRANDFLSDEVKKDNVSWLGNLNFAVLSLKDNSLTFTKTGNLKVLLIRNGQIIDVGKNLDLQEIEPYPLKIFFNVVSGKLIQDDIILVLTKEVFEFFHQQNLLAEIAGLEKLDEKRLKKILPSSRFKKGDGAKISGICFLTVIKKPSLFPAGASLPAAPQKVLINEEVKENAGFSLVKKIRKISFGGKKVFFLSRIFSPILKPLEKIKRLTKRITQILRTKKVFLKMLKKPQIKIPGLGTLKKINSKIGAIFALITVLIKFPSSKKKLLLVFALLASLFFGYLIFKQPEEKKEIMIKISLEEIQEKVNQAENFLIFKNEEEANSLLKEAWWEILPLTEKDSSSKTQAISLKQSIEKSLEDLNKLEKIENPKILTELSPEEPDIEHKKRLYSFSEPALFFSPPNTVFILKNEKWQEKNIQPPESDFNLDLFSFYASSLYFLDSETCKIIKYPHLRNLEWGLPQNWLKDTNSEKNCLEPKSMAIDGSIWILNNNNSINLYHLGSYQETITIDIFPFAENITEIKTKPNISHLFLLEPVRKRVIVITKEGKIVKQFQSEKFDDLKDFTVSADGKIIWLLNGLKIYQIRL